MDRGAQQAAVHSLPQNWTRRDWAHAHRGSTLSAGIQSIAFLLLGYSCFTVLVSAARRSESAKCVHMSPSS